MRNERTNPPGCRARDFSSFVIDEERKKKICRKRIEVRKNAGLNWTVIDTKHTDTHARTHHTLQHIRPETPCQCWASRGFTPSLLLLYTVVQVETRGSILQLKWPHEAVTQFIFFLTVNLCIFLFPRSHFYLFSLFQFHKLRRWWLFSHMLVLY